MMILDVVKEGVENIVFEKAKHKRTYYVLIVLFSVILFYICIFTRFTTDYGTHTASMEKLSIAPLINPFNWPRFFSTHGYPLWHICGHFIMRILSCPADYAAGICSGVFLVFSYIGVLRFFDYKFIDKKVNENIIAFLTFLLFVVGPVWLPWKNEYIIFHNGGPNVWHNATNICGRAVGIFAFCYSMRLIDQIVDSKYVFQPRVSQYMGLSFLYLLSLIAKPSFAQSYVPAFGILLIYYLIKSKAMFLKQFICFIATAILPGVRLLFQLLFYFSTSSGNAGIYTEKVGEGIIIEIPAVADIVNILNMQVLILLFPMVLFVIALIKGKFDRYHAMSLMMLLFSLIYILMLKGAAAGEMGWAYYIALFFVFMVAMRDYIAFFFSNQEPIKYRYQVILFMVSSVILIEHIAVGLYYLYQLIVMGMPRF